MRISDSEGYQKGLIVTRWTISGFFFFLAMMKLVSMVRFGIAPYEKFVIMSGLPEVLKYYGVFACAIEFYVAVGVWIKKTLLSAVVLTMILSLGGVALSIYSLILKSSTDCHCGLLGSNEYGLLGQKLIIIGALLLLAKHRERLTF
jgi:hypothetical protein